jgi:hypothetical protein
LPPLQKGGKNVNNKCLGRKSYNVLLCTEFWVGILMLK